MHDIFKKLQGKQRDGWGQSGVVRSVHRHMAASALRPERPAVMGNMVTLAPHRKLSFPILLRMNVIERSSITSPRDQERNKEIP